jgi:hypothetical protein
MSDEAIDRRFRELGQLYDLGMQLKSARWIGKLSREGDRPGDGGDGNVQKSATQAG